MIQERNETMGAADMERDRIEKEIVIAAPIERVWTVLTDPVHVGNWFGTGKPVGIDLRPGGVMEIDHTFHEPNNAFLTKIVKVDPPHAFSYLWPVASPKTPATDAISTLVEFTLTAENGGTRVRVVESGFSKLTIPASMDGVPSFDSHSEGWPYMLGRLNDYVDGNAG
jgi:uncharacterized protein YndB with AHSA1/START domain